jgi:hypothetical protein
MLRAPEQEAAAPGHAINNSISVTSSMLSDTFQLSASLENAAETSSATNKRQGKKLALAPNMREFGRELTTDNCVPQSARGSTTSIPEFKMQMVPVDTSKVIVAPNSERV